MLNKLKTLVNISSVLLLAALFIFTRVQAAVVINEVMYGNKDSTKNEFVELYNNGNSPIVLDKYKLTKKTASGSESYLVSSSKFLGTILPHGYFIIAYPDYVKNINADLAYSGSSYSIAADNSILLYDSSGKLVDAVGYGKATFFEKLAAPDFDEGQSIGRIGGQDTDDNSQDFTVQDPTPGKENKNPPVGGEEKIPDAPKEYSDKIQLNELYPYPNVGEEEFIELYNSGSSDQDLFGYTLHDASKTGEYDFKDHQTIHSRDFLVLYGKKDFSFALNNSGGESVTLSDGNGEIVSNVSYDSAKQGISYDFDGSNWHWSKFISPGEQNIFENVPDGGLDLPEDVFVNVYAYFSVNGLDSDAKVTWDFGDGHKSYLLSTKHKYAKTGKYEASVTYSHGSEDETKNFSVDVEEIAHPKIKIIAVNANPAGADTGKEFLTIENKEKKKSKRKINLIGWSIATCWKKCVNHPIREDFKIKGRKPKNITGDYSSFTLNNTKAKIELRYPDGKVAQKLKYKKIGSVGEDEIYMKIKGGWEWEGGDKKQVTSNKETTNDKLQITNNIQNSTDNIQTENAEDLLLVTGQPSSVIENAGTQNAQEIIEPTEIKKENKLDEINNENIKIEILKNIPHVLGSGSVREIDGQYLFTPPAIEQGYYAVTFFKNISADLNSRLNELLNYFGK